MRTHFLLVLVLLVGGAVLMACNSAGTKVTKIGQSNNQSPSGPTTYADGAARITITELQDKLKKNEVYIVDVRDEASFNAGHLPGAKLIPHNQILNHVNELPKDKLIVTYCS